MEQDGAAQLPSPRQRWAMTSGGVTGSKFHDGDARWREIS